MDMLLMVLDVSLVAYLFYRLFLLIRGTRAVPLLNGLFILASGYLAASFLRLHTVRFLLDKILIGAAVAIPVILQPELRRALEHLGRGSFLPSNRTSSEEAEEEILAAIDQVVRAVEVLGRAKTGALIVLERETPIGEFIDTGVQLDARISAQLLTNLFVENTPLHDGAVILRGARVAAASCWLPLAEARVVAQELGSRHRAGIGITEQSDALSIIVSEETGMISVAQGGRLQRPLDEKMLTDLLKAQWLRRKSRSNRFWHWGTSS
ncbi:MAG TPA: diadenylate cyclase CdaA [Symbiobacteriaceae bacterium]|nr:diadenylate cyclase CdaA [Symbiobacteriaceae bacterium]